MAKMRVHELAKELNINSKEILDTLSATEFAVKSHSSSVDDAAQNIIRKKFNKGALVKEEKNNTPVVETKSEEKHSEADRPKKKSSITAVFNPQNSKTGNTRRPNQPQRSGERPQGQRPQNDAHQENHVTKAHEENTVEQKEVVRPQTETQPTQVERPQSDRPQNDRPRYNNNNGDRPQGDRPRYNNNNGDRPRYNNNNGERPRYNNNNGDRPQYNNNGDRPRYNNNNGDRPRYNNNNGERPQYNNNGDRPRYNNNNGDRPQYNNNGDRPRYNNNNGDRPRYNNNGERPQYNNNGDRPRYNNNNGDRPQYNNNRPQGDRPSYGDRNGRPQGNGQRGNYQGQRPAGGGYGQNRGGQGNGNYRGNNNGGGRLDREIDRFKKDSAAPAAEELRGKESRDRVNDKNRNVKKVEHDALGSKRQERYVNLEKNGGKKKPQQQPQPKQEEDVIKTLILPEKLTIRELADKMKVQPSVIVKKLFLKGTMVTVNQEVDYEQAEEIALEFNCICEAEVKVDVIAELLKEDDDAEDTLVARPPVVCVMGHVDHGKTSLLDAIRSTRVTDREAGGITQHIGASVVSINNQNITFLDTPGHEAFTAMRMRGANSTDIAILVVAADDGVMPQTIEAINHAKAAGVEIIVAINKIDKPSANIERVKQELSEYELIPEDWGGSTIFCPVSAHTREGIENLLEMILLTSEVLELKSNPKRNARGLVIEAQLDKGRGAVATVLVQKGTLHVGDPIACGSSFGKVRAMIDDKGRRVKEAGPSTPVEILGLSSVPDAGETFVCCDSEKEARAFAETYISEGKNKLIEDTKAKMSLDDLFSQIQSGNVKELNIIVKADVQGSVEAVKQSLVKLSNEEVVVKVIHGGVGAINESDVILASASNAIIIGFNVRPDPTAKITAERESVDVRLYKVIYNAIEDVAAAMKGMLDPIFEEKVTGHAEIRQIFKASGIGNIAGSYILDGYFQRGCKVRVTREGEQIFEGDLASLKRFKDDVKEVKAGYECGLVFDGFNEIEELDQVEGYIMVEVPR